jgi:hypothetical protein
MRVDRPMVTLPARSAPMHDELDENHSGMSSTLERKGRTMSRDVSAFRCAATILGMLLLVSCSSGDQEPSSNGASAAASPSVQILNDCPDLPCEGPLEPGAYRWTFAAPNIDFAIESPRWKWLYGGNFHIIDADAAIAEGIRVPEGIYFLPDPAIASQDCEEEAEPGVGRPIEDLVTWLEDAPGLVVSEPTPVTLGGLDGVQVDLKIDPDWKKTCFFSEKLPVVPLLTNPAELGGYSTAIVPGQRTRWYILDSDDGVLIVDLEDGPGGLSHDDLINTGTAIVQSFEFSWPA